MADNIVLNSTNAAGATLATDQVGLVHYQRTKVTFGTDGTATDVSVSDPLPVTITGASNPATATLTNVASSASNVSLLASNTSRKGLVIVNDSTQRVYINFGATASSTAYTYYLEASDTLEILTNCYTGAINGIWASANGFARITELT